MFINTRLVILYGSQTGNAQDLAQRIWRESKCFYFKSTLQSMDDYEIVNLISEKCVIFVCSTTGQGEEPDNMRLFWKFLLRRNLPTNSLANLNFAVLGLGDSSFVKYNFVAKRLHKRLQQLGAQPLIPLGLGDDQHDLGYDAVADPWIETLWNKLLTLYPLPEDVQPLSKSYTITPSWNVAATALAEETNKAPSIYLRTKKSDEFVATVLDNIRITHQDHFQDVRLIKFQVDGHVYSPGDVLTLRPKNLPWKIEEFLDLLQESNLNFHGSYNLSPNYPELSLPSVLNQNLTFNQLCEEYFDLMSIPRRETFKVLAQITDSELEKEKCLEFTTAEGQEERYTYCNRPKRNIVEILRDFPHATKNLTREMLFEILPAIKPREFSIASNCNVHKDEVHLLVAVVKYKTKLVKERFGLCSNYLAELEPGEKILVGLKRGSFKFPQDPGIPVIMVGPGTGFAPFRNFIYERTFTGGATDGNLLLFFGCRHPEMDYHCREELEQLRREEKLFLVTAFSRQTDHKVYVQDKIVENGAVVWQFLQNNCMVFVAGSAKLMPQQVRQAFLDVCQNFGKLNSQQAEAFIEAMEKKNYYQTECWC